MSKKKPLRYTRPPKGGRRPKKVSDDPQKHTGSSGTGQNEGQPTPPEQVTPPEQLTPPEQVTVQVILSNKVHSALQKVADKMGKTVPGVIGYLLEMCMLPQPGPEQAVGSEDQGSGAESGQKEPDDVTAQTSSELREPVSGSASAAGSLGPDGVGADTLAVTDRTCPVPPTSDPAVTDRTCPVPPTSDPTVTDRTRPVPPTSDPAVTDRACPVPPASDPAVTDKTCPVPPTSNPAVTDRTCPAPPASEPAGMGPVQSTSSSGRTDTKPGEWNVDGEAVRQPPRFGPEQQARSRRLHLTSSAQLQDVRKQFSCTHCPYSGHSQRALDNHTRLRHANIGRDCKWKCSHCDYRTDRVGNMVRHRRKHTGERSYICDTCGKAFSWQTSLSRHRRKHTGGIVRQFKCSATFRKKSAELGKMKHQVASKKLYKCDLCSSWFFTGIELTRHRRTHTGDLRYSCTYCAAKFTRQSYMEDHTIRLHTHKYRYHCSRCDKGFATAPELRRHTMKCNQ